MVLAFGITIAISNVKTHASFSSCGFLFGQAFGFILFTFAAARGKVPNWLLKQD